MLYFALIIYSILTLVVAEFGADASQSSWWPVSSRWRGSGFDEGPWTWRNEVWFRDRLQLIRAGSASLCTSSQWKSKLRGDPEWVRVQENLRVIAREFIRVSYGTA